MRKTLKIKISFWEFLELINDNNEKPRKLINFLHFFENILLLLFDINLKNTFFLLLKVLVAFTVHIGNEKF